MPSELDYLPREGACLDFEAHDRQEARAGTLLAASEKIPPAVSPSNELPRKEAAVVSAAEHDKNNSRQHEDSNARQQPSTPQGWKLLAIVAALCLSVFLVAVDQTIVSTAIPRITDQFHSVGDIGW